MTISQMLFMKITHWQHPRFHAYFPAGNCYPSILGEMLSAGLGIVGFSWAASPSCTELETIVLDWLGRMINLPKSFLPFTENKSLVDKITERKMVEVNIQSNIKKVRKAESISIDVAHSGGGVILVRPYKLLF